MAFWKVLTLSMSIFAASTIRRCFANMKHSCKWSYDVLEMVSEPEKEFRPHHNLVHPGRSFFLRSRIFCKNQVNPFLLRSLVYSGHTPLMKLEITNYGLESVVNANKILYVEGAFIQFKQSSHKNVQGNFLVLNNSTLESIDQNCAHDPSKSEEIILVTEENLSSTHCSDFHLCNVAWLVPLPVEDSTVLIKCSITNPNEIGEKIYSIHTSGFAKPNGNQIGEPLGNIPNSYTIDQAFTVNYVAMPIPFWVVAAVKDSDYCLLTNSEFATTSVIKMYNVSQPGCPKVCKEPCDSLNIKETLSLPDRILLTTCFGLQEIRATSQNFQSEIILPLCIRKMVVPPQIYPGNLKVLVIEDSTESVFESDLPPETSVYFSELKDTENRTLCEFLASTLDKKALSNCVIQDGSINSDPIYHYVFLVSSEYLSVSYYIVGYTERKWSILFNFPSSLGKVQKENDEPSQHWTLVESSSSEGITLYLSGLSFTRNTGNNLFAWGNVLLYSPSGGDEFIWLWDFPLSSNITVFASTVDGSYAFLTESHKVWWGNTGSARVHFLEAAGKEWNIGYIINREFPSYPDDYIILSLFFDVSGYLWKVIQRQNKSSSELCISRAQVPVADILSYQQLIHEQTVQDDFPMANQFITNIPRHCLRSSIVYSVPHSNYYSRDIIIIVEVPHLINTVPVSFEFLESYLGNVLTPVRGTDPVKVLEVKAVLPEYIYLKKEDSYNFNVTMTLDTSMLSTVSSVYWSNLDNLRLSYHVSNVGYLNVTVTRRVWSHKGAVQYLFSLRDSGLLLKRSAPGVALRPVEFRVQPWQAHETCFVKKTEEGVLRGTQSMTVLLGCPPGLKIVFDADASINASKKNQFCNAKDGVACFLFEYTFNPIFNMVDMATGNSTLFLEKYQLTIVGGGEDLASVADYNQGDRAMFNYKNQGSSSTLVWTPTAKNLGSVPTFNISTNGLQWLCGRKSPCAEISPVFPHSPEFYFKLEISNRDIDDGSSNCDLTAQFIIRVHGLPLGSLYPATVIVAACMGILTSYVFTMYAFKRKDRKLWNLVHGFATSKREIFENWLTTKFRMKKSRVAQTNDTSSQEEFDTQAKKEA